MKKNILILGCLTLLIAGCTSTNKKVPQVAFSSVNNYDVDYEIIKDTKGTACKKSYALFPIPIWWGGSTDVIEEAKYNAIEAVSNSDALINPRVNK